MITQGDMITLKRAHGRHVGRRLGIVYVENYYIFKIDKGDKSYARY